MTSLELMSQGFDRSQCFNTSLATRLLRSYVHMLMCAHLQAEEQAKLASMSPDERKKYKQKQKKVLGFFFGSCLILFGSSLILWFSQAVW